MDGLDLASAEHLTARLVALLGLVDTAELWAERTRLTSGAWSWARVRAALPGLPAALGRVLGDGAFTRLLAARGALALVVLVGGCSLALVPLAVASALVWLRFGGRYNGGSDAMQAVVLGALVVSSLAPGSEGWRLGALGYVAAQSILSYAVAGLVKLREPAWRSGAALAELLALPRYGAPRALGPLLARPGPRRLAAWTVIGFECAFPLALTGPRAAATLVALALAFHAFNAWALGLNRFLLAWLATYPAILFWSARLG